MTVDDITSIVIITWEKGFVAHIRFTDPFYNEDISADTKWGIYSKIETKLSKLRLFQW